MKPLKKPFKLLLLPLLATNFLNANTENINIPKSIEIKLCKKLLNKECNSKQILESDYYFNLDNNKTLFFFHINHKDGQYQHGYQNLSAIVDSKNQWKISSIIIDAEIQEIVQDSLGGIWLRTLWMIEGVSPSLHYSKDALNWKNVTFPKKRESSGAFENLKLCFLDKDIELTFGKIDHKKSERTWSATYDEASSPTPKWNALNYSKACPNIFVEHNDSWSIEKSKNGTKMVFKAMEIPKELNSTDVKDENVYMPYTIQIGAFKHKESLEAMKKAINSIDITLISRELTVNDKKKYKLFLGSYNDYENAKKKLEKLKRIYTKNNIIQSAYVTKLP